MKTSGIYLIVLGHMFPSPGTNFIYSFSVPLFFFISGFLFYQQKNFNTFFIRNFHSLIIPYLFINCISLIFVVCFSSSFSWKQSGIDWSFGSSSKEYLPETETKYSSSSRGKRLFFSEWSFTGVYPCFGKFDHHNRPTCKK